jgi:hypothetical protein
MKRKIKQNELSDNEKVKISKKSKTEGEYRVVWKKVD